LRRHWFITNARGKVQEVDGPGVVGQQPYILPGESFEYTSFCPLDTEFGTMQGTYQLLVDDGTAIEARIAPFLLARPHAVN
jgi:ApaG protein